MLSGFFFTTFKQNPVPCCYYFNIYLKINTMGNLLYLVAVVLVILWVIGFLFHGFGDVGNIIHVLLVIAVIAILLKVIGRAA